MNAIAESCIEGSPGVFGRVRAARRSAPASLISFEWNDGSRLALPYSRLVGLTLCLLEAQHGLMILEFAVRDGLRISISSKRATELYEGVLTSRVQRIVQDPRGDVYDIGMIHRTT